MRPLKLKISAFGPFADVVEIDFEKFKSNSLYLICGDTGAGKTTIFDAICFALYGRASGQYRESTSLRSKYALPDTKTFAQLTFEYSHSKYTVTRNPDYERPKKRGEGTTREKADAVLIMPDGSIISSRNEVDRAIHEIMGMDAVQFCQIAMIAQGDFARLLNAPTDERMKIFRKIFNTWPYRELQEELKKETLSVYDGIRSALESIRQSVEGICVGDASEYAVQLEEAKAKISAPEDFPQLLDAIIKEEKVQEKALQERCFILDKDLEKLQSEMAAAAETEKIRQRLKEDEAALEAALKKLFEERAKLSVAEDEKKSLNKTEERIEKINAQLPGYVRLEECINEAETAQEQLKKLEAERESSQRNLDEMKKSLTEALAELEALKEVSTQKVKALHEKEDVLRAAEEIKNIEDENAAFTALKMEYEKKKAEYLRAREDAQKKKKLFDEMNRAYLDEQAGILAKELVNGKPCPVCGSKQHPAPAAPAKAAPSKKELEKYSAEAQRASKKESEASQSAGMLKGSMSEKYERLISDAGRIFETPENDNLEGKIEEAKNTIKEKFAAVQGRIEALKAKEKRKYLLEEETEQLQFRCTQTEKQIILFESSKTALTEQISAALEKSRSLRHGLMFENSSQAREELKALKSDRKRVEENYKITVESCSRADKEYAALKTLADSERKNLEGRKEADIALLTSKKEECERSRSQAIEERTQISAAIYANIAAYENIDTKVSELKKLKKRYSLIKPLSDTASGLVSGKQKIQLETYVQMKYFERIIARANTRFMVMSEGRYELKRSLRGADGRAVSGLELNIIDHYNGSERSVKTLSGGETFLASLALALGLSDEVQSRSGGISLESVFIDEGFGSLDPNTLRLAMRSLNMLAGGRHMVGIISHVEELREKIDTQIVVAKGRDGRSSVEVIV